jgi:hypothetical protein
MLRGCATRVQGPSGDQVGLGQGPHTHIASAQVGAMTTIQGGQGGMQACSRTFCRRHSNLPTFFYLGVRGPERLMRGIMEHARGWCK